MEEPDKIQANTHAPVPKTTTKLHSFLVLACYLRRFIKKFARISATLHAGTSINISFQWNSKMQKAFELLTKKLATPFVLAFLNIKVPFCVETDASGKTVGAVKAQKGGW